MRKLKSVLTGALLLCTVCYCRAQQQTTNKNSTYHSKDLLPRTGWVAWSNANGKNVQKALDGNVSTRWTTAKLQTSGQEFGVDMKKNYKINSIILDQASSAGDRPAAYLVFVGKDSSHFGEPVAKGEGEKGVTFIKFPAVIGRYIKIVQTGKSGGYWSIHELYVNSTSTIINPINLSYRFCLDTPSRREAADPTMVNFKGQYYLFASKSGGYFHSTDLKSWQLITTKDLPLEDYAPTAVVIRDTVYFMAGASNPVIYKSGDPKSGKWSVANAGLPLNLVADPCLFLDEDGRLFLYYGCSDVQPLYGVELDRRTFNPVGKPVALLKSDTTHYGWERKGDHNELPGSPWIEGSWMNKHNGKYYLQYAGPGTEFKSYSDGVYVSKSPLGPFKLGRDNPFSSKPEGFIAGAGHGSTFKDNYGNYWHIATMTISQKHMFERRLGLFPTFFDKDGGLTTYTGFGDFPFYLPTARFSDPRSLFTNWMLLSYKKQVQVSSVLPGHGAALAADENIRTYWSARTGGSNEWIQMDLGHLDTVKAIQLNFAENNTNLFGRDPALRFQYKLLYSKDGKRWQTLMDKSKDITDLSHDYIELTRPVQARFIKLLNQHVPGGTFALSDLRVFGNRNARRPQVVQGLQAIRSRKDPVLVELIWKADQEAVGYNIRYGTDSSRLCHNYQVLGDHRVIIRSLNASEPYYFTVDAFNESGVTRGRQIIGTR